MHIGDVRRAHALSHHFRIDLKFQFHICMDYRTFVCVCPAKETPRRKKIKMASAVRVSAFDQINGWHIVFVVVVILLLSRGEQSVRPTIWFYFSTINIVFLFALFVAHNAIKISNEQKKKNSDSEISIWEIQFVIDSRVAFVWAGREVDTRRQTGSRYQTHRVLSSSPCFDRFYPFVITSQWRHLCERDFFSSSAIFCIVIASVPRSPTFRNRCEYWDVVAVVVGN